MGRSNLRCTSLAGLRCRDISEQSGIHVRQWQLCKLDLPLVAVSMVVSSAVLVGEAYIVHKNTLVMASPQIRVANTERTSGELIRCVASSVYRDQTNTATFRSTCDPEFRKHFCSALMPPLTDILHRTLVVGLLGATVAGVGVGWGVHKDTLRRGQGS